MKEEIETSNYLEKFLEMHNRNLPIDEAINNL